MEEKEAADALQEQLLRKLTEYGDSVLEAQIKSGKKKKRKLIHDSQLINSDNNSETKRVLNVQSKSQSVVTQNSHTDNEPRKKKRKKKKKSENAYNDVTKTEEKVSDKKPVTGLKKHMEGIVGELGLKEFKSDLQKQEVSDRGAAQKKCVKGEPEIIVFKSHRDRKPKEFTNSLTKQRAEDEKEFDIKQARFEVRKFGLAGFHGDEKEKAMTDLLLRLGAKPKKKAYVNYKELLEKRKQEMMSEDQKREQDRQQGLKVGKKKTKKRARDKNDVGSVDGQVGKFVRGVQFVKPNDVQGIKKSKLKIK